MSKVCISTIQRLYSMLRGEELDEATPSRQTFGFFERNLVMEYNHERAVADGVNVGYGPSWKP